MSTLFEQLGGTYSAIGGYNFPDLCLPGKEYQLGKHGRMRLDFLKRHRRVLYTNLLTSGALNEHLWDIDRRCTEQVDQLVAAFAKADGTDEELKATEQMKWVGLMNSYRNAAEEITARGIVMV